MTVQRSSEGAPPARSVDTRVAAAARRLRSLVRRSELSLVLLAAVIGVAAGLSVALIGTLSSDMHSILFGVGAERLSGVAKLPRGYVAPIAGGLILGASAWLWQRRRSTIPVDPIEANALHGGRMSLRDSLWVTAQTLIANGFGASVGLEAGYAQTGAGLASKLGAGLRLRRNDMRILVGCGAGGAIGSAFGAPLTGAFYAFELIVGSYSVANVAPILAASVAGVLTARAVRATTYHIAVAPAAPMLLSSYAAMLLLGVVCAGFGILIMRAVYLAERGFTATRLPRAIRPMIGGAVMTGLALITPQVLSAGH